MRWLPGNIGERYFKLKLLSLGKLELELWRFDEGAFIAPHIDEKIPGFDIWRIHFFLNETAGGVFVASGKQAGRFCQVVNVDRVEHWVTKVEAGRKYVLSLSIQLPEVRL